MPETVEKQIQDIVGKAPDGAPCGTVEAQEEFYYRDDLDYLQDFRLLFQEKRKLRMSEAGLDFENPRLAAVRDRIGERRSRARAKGVRLRVEELAQKLGLNGLQEDLLCGLIVEKLTGEENDRGDDAFLRVVAGENLRRMIEVREALEDLKRWKLVGTEERRFPRKTAVDEDLFAYVVKGTNLPSEKFAPPEPEEKPGLPPFARAAEKFRTPGEIHRELSRFVVGQERAKRALAVAAFSHLAQGASGPDSGGRIKQNILLAGPTGCGKTHLALTLANVLGIPFAAGDATTWTEEGYVGANFDEVLWRLFQNAGRDRKAAETGLVYIDEVDKLAQNDSRERGVGDVSVQRALLKALEGSAVTVTPGGLHSWRSTSTELDTANILFVLGGAFTGIEEIVARRRKCREVGFAVGEVSSREEAGEVTADDLVEYGLIREFVGRIPVIAPIDPLSPGDFVRILGRPETGLVAGVNRECRPLGLSFKFTPGALKAVAEAALETGTGARSLQGIVGRVIEPSVYELGRAGAKKVREIRLGRPDIVACLSKR